MIKFEEHDDNLFRMLEEPVPLTDDAELPVLVRLIQDDTMLGKANKRSCHPDTLAQKIICSSSKLTDDGLFMDGNYTYCYEIIGTLVEEGSGDWAWYQMMKGEKISYAKLISKRFYTIKKGCDYCAFYKSDGNEVGFNTRRTYGEFIEYSKSFGISNWQIYKEPKPLLAEAKVGDLVKLRNGSYSQIVEVKDGSVFKYQNPEVISSVALFLCDENGDTSRWGKVKDVDIIHTEPLAPEGTKEWAWQMMLLGKIIIHSEYRHENATWKMNNGIARSCLAGMSACSKEQWVANAIDNGWQLYKEPKPEPAKEPIADCDNCKHRCTKSNIDYCQMYEPKPLPMASTHDGLGDKFLRDCLKPNEHPIITGCNRLDYVPVEGIRIPKETEPEPAKEQFEVGDWVEFIDVGGRKSQGKCLSNADDRHYAIIVLDTTCNMRVVVPTTKIIRKLSHSEVVVRITISGTVRPAYNEDGTIDDEQFQLLPSGSWDGTEMFVSFDALDSHTRKLVESLLKAQEQNNG